MLIFRRILRTSKWMTPNKFNKLMDNLTENNIACLYQILNFLSFRVILSESGIYVILPNMWATWFSDVFRGYRNVTLD